MATALLRQENYEAGMTFFYISDDFENDVRRCIQSWERQHPIAITGLTVEGQVRHFTGTVQTIDHDSQRAIGRLWRVLIREISPGQKTMGFVGGTST
jgi:hypothetical protein